MSFKIEQLGNVRYGFELEDILRMKGIENIPDFINPTLKNVESELLYDNIIEARDCFVKHIDNNDEIDIVVDCDVDGNTSAAYMYQYIKLISPNVNINCLVHDKKVHGISDKMGILLNSKSRLVIIPDAGSGDWKECEQLIKAGKDVIILDHHDIDVSGNPAIVVNNQASGKVTDKALTGVGVVHKFCKVLDAFYGVAHSDKFLDLVAVGLIGDRADTKNLEVRYYIFEGIRQMSNKTNYNKLLSTLIQSQLFVMNNKITITGIGFYICPLINSLIRLGECDEKIKLFEAMCSADYILERKVRGKGMVSMTIQEYIVKSCEASNRKQKKLTEESATLLSEQVAVYDLDKFPILVVNAGDSVDGNSTGLIANKLADMYKRPCLLMRRKGDICKGSARGYDKCSIVDFNKWCTDTGLFEFCEGHSGAFGVGIQFKNTYKLFELLSTMESINETIYHVCGIYDANVLHDQIIKGIAKYDYIWGNTVDAPIFYIKNLPVNKYNVNLIGSKQNRIEFLYHNIKVTKMTRSTSLMEEFKDIVNVGNNILFDVVGRFALDGKEPQIIVEDWEYKKDTNDKISCFGL